MASPVYSFSLIIFCFIFPFPLSLSLFLMYFVQVERLKSTFRSADPESILHSRARLKARLL